MKTVLDPRIVDYFFGQHFPVKVAEAALAGTPESKALATEAAAAAKSREIHTGFQLVCYKDLDSGALVAVAQKGSDLPSMVSLYIRSNHPYFGGQTILCVPFQFLTGNWPVDGEHLVYRHTYKTPLVSPQEYARVMAEGTTEEKINIFRFSRSREGYQTIPGMTYVGLTKRTWSKRYIQHIKSSLRKSSSARFHEAIRDMQGKHAVCVHDVSGYGLTEEAAREMEKDLIRSSSLYPKGLNMRVG